MKKCFSLLSNFCFILMVLFTLAAVTEAFATHYHEKRFCFLAIICFALALGFRILSVPISDGIYPRSQVNEKSEDSTTPKWIAVPDTQLEVNEEIIWRVRWTERDKSGKFLFAHVFRLGHSHKNEMNAKLLAKSLNEDEIIPSELDDSFQFGEL